MFLDIYAVLLKPIMCVDTMVHSWIYLCLDIPIVVGCRVDMKKITNGEKNCSMCSNNSCA